MKKSMENHQIYFPNDLIRTCSKTKTRSKTWYLIGFKQNNVYVVVQILESNTIDFKTLPSTLKELRIIGSINDESPKYDLNFGFNFESKLPFIRGDSNFNYCIIIFQPPNFKNLEYFSIEPILLQSMGNENVSTAKDDLVKKLVGVEPVTTTPISTESFISDDSVLEKINQVVKIRIEVRNCIGESPSVSFHPSHYAIYQNFRRTILGIVIQLIRSLQYVLIFLIWVINIDIFKFNLVETSKVFRSLDLRLKQLNYFPIQFLLYYEKSVLSKDDNQAEMLKELHLPIFNSSLNINNSNYINLYNSLWLIFNDILYGTTAYKIIMDNFDSIINFLHKTFIQKYLFNELIELISWVSLKHPAGFKLNNELGQFMGDLFIWTLKFWKFLVNDVIELNLTPHLQIKLLHYFKIFLMILCYFGGLSFLLGFIIDILNILTVHISFFYYSSTKVYKKQLEVIKSLFQLFRGKKYNVLRNRIDNLNNYEDSNEFEIDQLLLGTLLFMVLVLLMPTVFAFYLMYFLIWLTLLATLNFLENVQIIVNFTPLFVILLKLKNSNRLQGGINFNYITNSENSSYVRMCNKSLSYNEIFTNFIQLFRNSKNFRKSIIQNFFTGQEISIKYNNELKFHYLMLPANYDKTTSIWKHVK
ncbi:glycosylphosphatidylinositol synthesis N-acetylglucosaminyltransferase complex, subunit PIG-Q/GPI1 [Scheffersomyces xylosifermentans]|uniref:glycosylphosphatidylinositol synthesis N-acetylglucosaminyltransferase complex, subunit PIG-Q/GPI1 n=1 Tax=Scheffersomyces xylosifermentans TaxID=1304137 RepID=UPI00315D7B3D